MLNLKSVSYPKGALAIGEQVKFNHVGCSAGTDTKNRLYIKRVHGGIVGYCHHCSQGGFLPIEGKSGRELTKWLKSESKDPISIVAEDANKELNSLISANYELTLDSLTWLNKYEMKNGFVGDSEGRVVLPIFDENTIAKGYQIRNNVGVPKYITKIQKDYQGGSWYKRIYVEAIFLTEDILSAVKIYNNSSTIVSLALLGTSLRDQDEKRLLYKYKYNKIFIWLDNDRAGIEGAKKILERLTFLGFKAEIITKDEPKKVPTHMLKPYLKEKIDGL